MSSGEFSDPEAMPASIEPRALQRRAREFGSRLVGRLGTWWDSWTAEGGVAEVQQFEATPPPFHRGDGPGLDIEELMATMDRLWSPEGVRELLDYLDGDDGGDVENPAGAVAIESAAPGSETLGSVVIPRLITGKDDLLPLDSGPTSAIGAEKPSVLQDTL